MPIEIEKKYRLNEQLAAELTTKLEETGAEFAYEDFEENSLYRGGVLDERGAVLRLRKTANRTILTYKEKAGIPGEFKQQTEFETEVTDVEAITSIIERLGFTLALVYEKRRRAWKLGGTEVVLDELPFGYYMEIEGKITDIVGVEMMLNIEELEVEPIGYPGLTAKFGTRVGDVVEARFEQSNAGN
jgi:adenylate cyclase, class 2